MLPSILVSDATVNPLPVANVWLLVNDMLVIAPLISTVAVALAVVPSCRSGAAIAALGASP